MRSLLHPLGCWSVCLLFLVKAHSATFIVADPSDTTNVTSLRGAIIAANRLGGTNSILLTQLVYNLTIPGAGEDAALTGDLDVTRGSLNIVGISSSKATIDGTGLGDRVFHVLPSAELMLSNLTLTGGIGGDGGGIHNFGMLTIANCLITRNSSGAGATYCTGENGGAGGGIYNSGLLSIQDSTISSNFCGKGGDGMQCFPADDGGFEEWGPFWPTGPGGSGGSGGGLYNLGSATLVRCVITGNNGGAGGSGGENANYGSAPGGDGGGICNYGDLNVTESILSDNCGGGGGVGGNGYLGFPATLRGGPGGSGGAIYNAGTAILNTSTLALNSAGAGGGAIAGPAGGGGSGGAIYTCGNLKVNASTIAYNVGGVGGAARVGGWPSGGIAGIGGNGGGIVNAGDTSNAHLHNTLVALNESGLGGIYLLSQTDPTIYTNRGSTGNGPDLSGSFTSKGHNLISQADASTGFTNESDGDLVGSLLTPLDAKIGPLQSNGGATPTCALLPGSLAIDAGDRLATPGTDQRGYPRLIGSAPDIGAFEFWPASRLQFSTDELQFLVTGVPGKRCAVQASANLKDWVTIANMVADSNGTIVYHEIGILPQRLYRATFSVERPPVLAVTTTTAAVLGSSTNWVDANIVSSAVTAKVTAGVSPYEEVSWEYVSGSSLIVPTAKSALKTTFHGTVPFSSKLTSSYRLKVVDAAENVAYGPPVLITLRNSAPVVREMPRPGQRYLP